MRNTMQEDRLAGLALMYFTIHKKLTKRKLYYHLLGKENEDYLSQVFLAK